MAQQFRKEPVVIDAMQLAGSDHPVLYVDVRPQLDGEWVDAAALRTRLEVLHEQVKGRRRATMSMTGPSPDIANARKEKQCHSYS